MIIEGLKKRIRCLRIRMFRNRIKKYNDYEVSVYEPYDSLTHFEPIYEVFANSIKAPSPREAVVKFNRMYMRKYKQKYFTNPYEVFETTEEWGKVKVTNNKTKYSLFFY